MKVIHGFPLYQISEEGTIRNINNKRIRKTATSYGTTYVILSRNGSTYRRRVEVLLKEAF